MSDKDNSTGSAMLDGIRNFWNSDAPTPLKLIALVIISLIIFISFSYFVFTYGYVIYKIVQWTSILPQTTVLNWGIAAYGLKTILSSYDIDHDKFDPLAAMVIPWIILGVIYLILLVF